MRVWVFFAGDMPKAFDNVSLGLVERALRWYGCPIDLIASVIDDLSGNVVVAEWEMMNTEAVDFNKCIRTVGKYSTFIWRVVVLFLFSQLVEIWDDMGLGFGIGSRTINHIIWANNIWLLADSRDTLLRLVDSTTQVFWQNGLYWKPSSLCWMAAGADVDCSSFPVQCVDEVVECKRVEKWTVLGSTLRDDGKSEDMVTA